MSSKLVIGKRVSSLKQWRNQRKSATSKVNSQMKVVLFSFFKLEVFVLEVVANMGTAEEFQFYWQQPYE
jgi:hypothetical protein